MDCHGLLLKESQHVPQVCRIPADATEVINHERGEVGVSRADLPQKLAQPGTVGRQARDTLINEDVFREDRQAKLVCRSRAGVQLLGGRFQFGAGGADVKGSVSCLGWSHFVDVCGEVRVFHRSPLELCWCRILVVRIELGQPRSAAYVLINDRATLLSVTYASSGAREFTIP